MPHYVEKLYFLLDWMPTYWKNEYLVKHITSRSPLLSSNLCLLSDKIDEQFSISLLCNLVHLAEIPFQKIIVEEKDTAIIFVKLSEK